MPSPSKLSRQRMHRGHRRGGFAVLLVLALISMTLGVSYSLLRTQAAAGRVANNGRTQLSARQAALTGLSAGLRRISQTSWGGVGSTITGNLTGSDSYTVGFTAGDASLSLTGTQADDYPYRVTMLSTGYAVDPGVSDVTTTYQVEAVVQLVPKALASNPSPWSTMLPYVFYQTAAEGISVELPLRVNGPMRWQGGLTTFLSEYPTSTPMRNRYLSDLNQMRSSGYPDFRPFTGPIITPTSATSANIRSQLTTSLAITLSNAAAVTTSNWSYPANVQTYRLYPGGTSYTIQTLGANVSGTTLQADPATNPAGIFYRNGDLTLGNNTTVVGTLIVSGNTNFSGTNINISPRSLMPISGTSAAPQLPVIISNDDVRVLPGSGATVRGVVATFDDFTSTAGTQATLFDLEGNLIARSLNIQARHEWDLGSLWWALLWAAFGSQSSQPYWPVYASGAGVDYTPRLTMAAQTGTVTKQWFTKDSPVYAVYSGDAGLQWSVLRITELR